MARDIGMDARSIYFPESNAGIAFLTNLGKQFPSENTLVFESTVDEWVKVTYTGSRD